MGSNPSSTEFTPDLPVNKVTWHEAREFCRRTTEQECSRGTLPIGYLYRLPTEAEWEYAYRAEAQKPDYRWILAGLRVVLAPPVDPVED